jgi:hypothetical protein
MSPVLAVLVVLAVVALVAVLVLTCLLLPYLLKVRSAGASRSGYLGGVSAAEVPVSLTEARTVFKGAGLVLTPGGPRFLGLAPLGLAYGADEDASCNGSALEPGHMLGCECGFHAYARPDAARNHPQLTPTSVLLAVVASGELLEHELGLRFTHQRITHVEVQPCTYCQRPSSAFEHRHHHLGRLLAPVCSAHVLGSQEHTTFGEVAALLSSQVPSRRPVVVRGSRAPLVRSSTGTLIAEPCTFV